MMIIREDSAVSPVIGTILLVAITVILAAIIATLVFGMNGNVQKTKIVALNVVQNKADIGFTYYGGNDHDAVQYLKISVPSNTTPVGCGGPVYNIRHDGGILLSTECSGASADGSMDYSIPITPTRPAVGSVWILQGRGSGAQDQVVVSAHFIDGYDQVILDTFV